MSSKYLNFKIKDASNVFFTSDTHFFHDKIIEMAHRPFSSIEEMNDTIITNWNNKVPKDGIVYHLGDFAWGNKLEQYKELISKLNGKIILIKGNHDEKTYLTIERNALNSSKNNATSIWKIEDRYVYLHHYPFLCYGGTYRKKEDMVYQLFGHIHSGKGQTGLDMPRMNLLFPTQYDVGMDNNNYIPLSWKEVDEKIKRQIEENKNMTMWWS